MGTFAKVKKRRRKRKILFYTLFIIAALIIGISFYIRYKVKPIIISFANEKVCALTSDAISAAVIDILENDRNIEYITVNRDEKNNIKSIETDAKTITTVAQRITTRSHELINKRGSEGIKIPMGSLSGLTVLTGVGPDVNVKVYLVGSTKTSVFSEFTATGINQTRHRLYIDIKGSVAVAIPGFPSSVNTSTRVLMGETVIVGEVPPTYLHSSSIGDMLDLVVE